MAATRMSDFLDAIYADEARPGMVTKVLMRVDARAPAAGQFAQRHRENIMAVASRANSDYGRFVDEVKDMSLFPLWERTGGLKPGSYCVPAHWSYASGAAAADPRLRPHHQEGGRAARAVPGEPDAARHHVHLRLAVRRIADHHAGRGRAVAPPHAERAALHRRGRGRLHGGRRREAADEARRLRGDAGLGLARPRQSRHHAGGLARRARHAVRALFRRGVPRGACRRQAADRPAGGRIRFRCTA